MPLSEACNYGVVTDPTPPPAWQAVEIGPGALDPLLIRPVGNVQIGGGRPGSPMGYPVPPGPDRSEWIQRAPVPGHFSAYQSGQLGHRSSAISMTDHSGPLAPRSYRDSQQKSSSRWRRMRGSKHFGTLVIGLIISVILTAVIWATAVVRNDDIAVGDCLTLGTLLPSEVGCDTVEAEFRVISRFDDTSDYTRCATDVPDAGLAVGNAVLCVNYVARVGDCLYAAEGSDVGKEPCSSQLAGLYQVVEVITNSLDQGKCPARTEQVLVHRSELEVICLVQNP